MDPSSTAAAAILIIRNGAHFASPAPAPCSPHRSADALLHEQLQLQWDTRALMRGRVVNKRARHNLCYGDVAQQPHYEAGEMCVILKKLSHVATLHAGKGRVVPYSDVPSLHGLRQALPQFFGPKANDLYAEARPRPCSMHVELWHIL